MKTARHVLEEQPLSERIEAVAEDFASEANFFAALDGFELAELLGLCPEEGGWSRTGYVAQVSLEDRTDAIYHDLPYLEGFSSNERISELTQISIRYEQGQEDSDAVLTEAERIKIEELLTTEKMDSGFDLVVARTTLISARGIELDFEAEIGDGGDCFACYGPYELRAGDAVDTRNHRESESW